MPLVVHIQQDNLSDTGLRAPERGGTPCDGEQAGTHTGDEHTTGGGHGFTYRVDCENASVGKRATERRLATYTPYVQRATAVRSREPDSTSQVRDGNGGIVTPVPLVDNWSVSERDADSGSSSKTPTEPRRLDPRNTSPTITKQSIAEWPSMCPSRRRVLAGAGIAAVTAVGAGTAVGDTRALQPDTDSTPGAVPDWPMSRYDPAGTAFSPTAAGPTDDVQTAWTTPAPDWFAGTSAPILCEQTLYAAGGGMLALDAETGARRFGFPGAYRSTPAVARTDVYRTPTLATTATAGLFGVNASGGIDLPFTDRNLGGERWHGASASRSSYLGSITPVPAVTAGGRVFTPVTGTNDLVAVDPANGDVVWNRVVHDDDTVGARPRRPAVREGTVYVTSWPHRATAYDAATGDRRWRRDLDDQLVLPPVATPAGVVVPSRQSVWLLDPDDGTTLWRRDLDGNATESAPAVADGRVFLSDERGSLYALDLATGETEWTTPFDGDTAPVVADGVVYAVRSGVELLAFDAATGDRRFRFSPSQVPLSPPAVGDGRLYLSNRQRVVALEEQR